VLECPDPSVLEAFVQGSLEPHAQTDFERHLDGCSECAETTAALARLFGSSTIGDGGPVKPHIDPATALVSVGRYLLGDRLGEGGMGVVFQAHDPELERQVAIKLLHPGTDDAEETREHLLREARAMAKLAHPNVVAVHDVGRVGDQVFLAMELVAGTTLTEWLRTPRSQSQIIETFIQAGRGLEAAHNVGLIHRDFKPDNVLIGADGRARVTDFGLARPVLAWADSDPVPSTPSGVDPLLQSVAVTTAHGAIVGTPAYMAPEQWRGEPADARSDQFSYCVALYEALVSKRPFSGDSWMSLCHAVLEGGAQPMPRSVPAWLRNALTRGLATPASQRHASMAELLAALARDRGRALRIAAVAGAMAVGAAATVGVLAWAADEASVTPELAAATAQAPDDPQDSPQPDAGTPRPDVGSPPDTDPPPPAAPTATQVCQERAKTVHGHWTPERRTAFADSLHKMDRGMAIFSQTMPILDRWATDYAEQAAALCDPSSSLKHRAGREACLANYAIRFDAWAVRVAEHKASRVARSVAGATYALPNLDHCRSDAWLSTLPTADPGDKRAKAHLLRSDLAAAQADLALMQLVTLPDDAKRIAADAEALGFPPLTVEAQLAAGLTAATRRDADAAVTWLEQAAVSADTAKHEAARAQAALALVVQQGALQLRPGPAKRWQRIARSQADRTRDARFGAAATLAEGQVLYAQLEFREARATLDDALAQHEEAYPEAHPQLALAYQHLAAVLADLGEGADAVRFAGMACAMLRKTVGPNDLALGSAQLVLAKAHIAAGNLDDALEAVEPAIKIPGVATSLRHDYDRGDALLLRGDIEAAKGDKDAALATYESARVYHYVGPIMAEPELRIGALLVAHGEPDKGLAIIARGLELLESHYGDSDLRLIPALRVQGRAQTATKAYGVARKTLQRALEIADTEFGYGALKAHALVELGDLEHAAGKKARALELMDDAHVPWVGAYGMDDPHVVRTLLVRADLAFALGKKDYAGRLYRSTERRFSEVYGETSPEAKRARARRTADE